ncbi:hypothetical protein [Halosimplex halobium]
MSDPEADLRELAARVRERFDEEGTTEADVEDTIAAVRSED